jgi:hypothetical protein
MMKIFSYVVLEVFFCGGCAETHYIKAGATQEDFEVD